MKSRLFLLASLISVPLAATVPNRITYQGRLSKTGVPMAGVHTFHVCLKVSSGPQPVCQDSSPVLPASGDFTLLIDVPPSVDWLATSVKIELTIDGHVLAPSDDFTAVPYALVASTASHAASSDAALTAQSLAAPLPADQVSINGSTTLDSWQSATSPALIDAAKIYGSLPGQWTKGTGGVLSYTGGAVGIGTSTPSVSLEVQGGAIKAGGGLIIETRTATDPASPAPGQMWLRTDIP